MELGVERERNFWRVLRVLVSNSFAYICLYFSHGSERATPLGPFRESEVLASAGRRLEPTETSPRLECIASLKFSDTGTTIEALEALLAPSTPQTREPTETSRWLECSRVAN